MKICRDDLDNEVITDSSCNRKGVVKAPLFDAFEPWEWVILVLHVMMGSMNSAISGLLEYIEDRHECITEEERQARNVHWKLLDTLNDVTESLKVLTDLDVERGKRKSELGQEKKRRTFPTVAKPKGTLFYTIAERNNIDAEMKLLCDEINASKQTNKPKTDDISVFKKVLL